MTPREKERAALIATLTEMTLEEERRSGNPSDPAWLRQHHEREITRAVDAALATLGPGEELTSLDLRITNTLAPKGN